MANMAPKIGNLSYSMPSVENHVQRCLAIAYVSSWEGILSRFSFIIDGSKIQPSPTYLLPLTTWNASAFAMSTSSFTSNFLQGTARITLLHLSTPEKTHVVHYYTNFTCKHQIAYYGLSTNGYLSTKLGPTNPLTSPLHFDHVSQGCSASKISALPGLPGCSHRLQVQLDDWPQSLVYLPSRIISGRMHLSSVKSSEG